MLGRYLEGEGAAKGADSGSSHPSAAEAAPAQVESVGGFAEVSAVLDVPGRSNKMRQSV